MEKYAVLMIGGEEARRGLLHRAMERTRIVHEEVYFVYPDDFVDKCGEFFAEGRQVKFIVLSSDLVEEEAVMITKTLRGCEVLHSCKIVVERAKDSDLLPIIGAGATSIINAPETQAEADEIYMQTACYWILADRQPQLNLKS